MKKTKSDIKLNLAYALEVTPDEIMLFQKYPTGYSVVTTSFQKFTDVQPAAPPKPAYPEGLPKEMQGVYDHPKYSKVQPLKDLAYFLKIPDASALVKAGLVEEITLWKKDYYA